MKTILSILIFLSLVSCQNKQQEQIDSITPGLGEYMAIVEYHHNNLSKAIKKQNYKRANYELDELMEVFEVTQKLHNNHEKLLQPLDKLLPKMMYTQIENIRKSLKTNDSLAIKKSFETLTTNCNACHAINKMAFIVIE
jgi:cytochrome c556